MRYDIFISYRRDGGYDTAQHLYNLLSRDGYRVSFDIDTLRNGDFDKSLLARIDQCKDFILILDQHAFDRTLDPDFDPDKDWLRQELAYALKKQKNIIPIFLAGVKGFPDNLPDDIKAVAKKNGPECLQGHFNVFYEDLKARFFVTPVPKHRSYLKILSAIVIIALACLGYIYWPYGTTNIPLSYADDWEDDVHVEIPDIYNLDLSSDLDDQVSTDVHFYYQAAFASNLGTGLVEEVYEDYSPEDIGLETEEQLEETLNILNSAGTKQFDEIYLKSLKEANPDSQHKHTYDYETENMEWRIYVRTNGEYEYYNAVYRVQGLGNLIFTMSLTKSWMPLKHWRNKYIVESTLDRVAKAYILYVGEE